MEINRERLEQILVDYISTDIEATETEYVLDMLRSTCGCSDEEIASLGFGWLLEVEEE